jgi:hypothetical protein
MSVTPVANDGLSGRGAVHNGARLQAAARQVVGQTFLGTLLRISRESPFKTPYGHGGRGEDVFRAELDRVVIEKASARLAGDLADAICRSMARGAGGSEGSAGSAAVSPG